jgi:hypothetical protein
VTSFAALMTMTNGSVLAHLANATVRIGGVDVPGLFTDPSSVAALGAGMADTRPSVVVDAAAVPQAPEGHLLEVDGVPYAIGTPAPDGTGLTRLPLELVQ